MKCYLDDNPSLCFYVETLVFQLNKIVLYHFCQTMSDTYTMPHITSAKYYAIVVILAKKHSFNIEVKLPVLSYRLVCIRKALYSEHRQTQDACLQLFELKIHYYQINSDFAQM